MARPRRLGHLFIFGLFTMINPQVIQFTSTDGSASSVTSINTAFTNNVVKGNLLLVTVIWALSTATCSLSDTLGNNYVARAQQGDTALGRQIQTFYVIGSASGANTVTASFSAATTFAGMTIQEVYGIDSTNPFIGDAYNTGTSTTPSTAGISPTNNGAFIYSFCAGTVVPSVTGSFTTLSSLSNDVFIDEYLVQQTAASIDGSFSLPLSIDNWSMGVLGFNPTVQPTTYRFYGSSIQYPELPLLLGSTPGTSNTITLDGTNSKNARIGYFWRPDRKGGNITQIHFDLSTIVKAGGSGFKVSIQGVTGGPPAAPDGVIAQSFNVPNGDIGFNTNTWCSGTLGSTFTASYGQLMSVVYEFDASGRLGTDSIKFQSMGGNASSATSESNSIISTNFNGTTWTAQDVYPILAFLCDDGVWGTLMGSWVHQSFPSTLTLSQSNGKELGLQISPMFPMEIEGIQAGIDVVSGTCQYTLNLYDGGLDGTGSALIGSGATFVGARSYVAGTTAYATLYLNSPVTVFSGHYFYLTLDPILGGSAAITVPLEQVPDPTMLVLNGGVVGSCLAQRTNAGAWSITPNQRPFFYPLISGLAK